MGSPFSSEFRASDAGEAEAHLRARYGALELSDAPLSFGERVRADAGFALVEHDYDGVFTIGGELDVFSVGLPTRAREYRWDIDGRRGGGTGQPVLFQPGQRIETHVDRVLMRATTFDAADLDRSAAALLGDDSLHVRFASARPRTGALGRLWASLVDFAVERDDPAYALLHASVRSALTRLLLEAFPLLEEPLERRATALGRWFGYRRGADFIDDNVSLPITLADIAAAAGLSQHDLDLAFRTHARATALGYLRRARLSAAHDDLLTADPAVASLDEIARRWGFATTERFARLYRDDFGVDPCEVLRRS